MLKIENLSYAYGKIQALRNINLELIEGKITAIIGSNGAGKSTLMKCIAGLLKPEGEIYFEEKLLPKGMPHKIVQSGIVLVPEGRQIFPNLSVTENLLMGGYCVKDRESGINRSFEMFPTVSTRTDIPASFIQLINNPADSLYSFVHAKRLMPPRGSSPMEPI